MRRRPPAHAHRGDKRSLGRILVAGSLWNQLSSVVPMALNLVATPYVIHGFGIARWGLFTLAALLISFLGPLNGGLGGAAGRYFAIYAGRDDRTKTTETLVTLATMLIVFASAAMAIGWFLSPTVIYLFHVPRSLRAEGIFLLRALTVITAVSFLHNLFSSVINARQRYALTNLTYVGTACFWTAGLVFCVHQHLGLRGVAFVLIGQQIIGTLLIVPSACRYLSRDGLRLLSLAETKEIGRYSLNVQAMSMIGLVNNQVDGVLVGGLFSVRTLAFYNAGISFATNLQEVLLNLMAPITTHLAQVYGREGRDGTELEFKRMQRLWVIGATGWTSVGVGACYFAVVAWLGPEFALGGEVATMALGVGIVYNWTNAQSAYLAAVGRADLERQFVTVALIVNVALTVPLALAGGALGVAAATGIATLIASAYRSRVVRRKYRSTTPGFVAEVPVIPALLAGAVTVTLEWTIHGVIPHGVVGLLACGVPAILGIGVFAAAVLKRSTLPVLRALRTPRWALQLILGALLDDASDQLHPGRPSPLMGGLPSDDDLASALVVPDPRVTHEPTAQDPDGDQPTR